MNKSFYFSHDYHSRNDPKLQKLMREYNLEGLGIFWCLVEMLYEQNGKLELNECDSYAFELRTDKDKIQAVINICFEQDGQYFWSNSVNERLKIRKNKSNKAKISARIRWKNQSKVNNANALPTQYEGNAIKERKGKEIKGKEKKEKYISSMEYLEKVPEEHIKAYVENYHISENEVRKKAQSLLEYCRMHGKKYKDYQAFLRNAISRDFKEKIKSNGQALSDRIPDNYESSI